MRLAEAHDFRIVEDDIFRDFEATPSPRLGALDGLQRIIHMASFSKTLSAATRIGYVAADPTTIADLADLKLAMSFGNNELSAQLVHRMLMDGTYRKQVAAMRDRLARVRFQVTKKLLSLGFVPWLSDGPDSGEGLFLWLGLPPDKAGQPRLDVGEPLVQLVGAAGVGALGPGAAGVGATGPGVDGVGAAGPGALRFSRHGDGCDRSARPLNAALHRSFSPVRRHAAGLLPAALRCSALQGALAPLCPRRQRDGDAPPVASRSVVGARFPRHSRLLAGRGVACWLPLRWSACEAEGLGGAYAVLAYVAQEAVETYGWLQPGEMADGLGLAETTPGPLIMVTQFVGFLAAFRAPEPFSPLMAGLVGAALTTWVTFAPCFLWIFACAPWIDHLRHATRLKGGLAAITATVVGVIGNLSVWFALHVLFRRVDMIDVGFARFSAPIWSSFDVVAAGLAALAFFLMFVARWKIVRTLGLCAGAGLLASLL